MSLWLRRRDLRTHLHISTGIKFLATYVYIFLIFFVILLLDFIIVTINLIQLLAPILIRINYLSLSRILFYLHLCFNLPTKWQTLLRMKYVLCSVWKGNTNNMMEKKWQCEILHIAGLLNSENPIQIQLKHSLKMYCRRRWGQLTAWKIQTIEQGRGRNGEEEGWGKIFVCQRDQERDIHYTTINK